MKLLYLKIAGTPSVGAERFWLGGSTNDERIREFARGGLQIRDNKLIGRLGYMYIVPYIPCTMT